MADRRRGRSLLFDLQVSYTLIRPRIPTMLGGMKRDSIVVAGGCFWGVEELIRAVSGVLNTEVGYCGGATPNPTYDVVKTGRSGHAEAVLIEFDRDVVSLEHILELFFQLHDPTTLNRQGNDVGTQYRSTLFPKNEEQTQIAQSVLAKLKRSGRFSRPIATTIEPLDRFYPAEAEHQDYLQHNPGGYTCHYWRE